MDLLYNIFTQQKVAFALERSSPCYVTKSERFRKEILELYLFGGGGPQAHVFEIPTWALVHDMAYFAIKFNVTSTFPILTLLTQVFKQLLVLCASLHFLLPF